MSRVWVFQDSRQKDKHGKNAPWSIGWLEPATNRRKAETVGTKTAANEAARQRTAELNSGRYQTVAKKRWVDFRTEYMESISGKSLAYLDTMAQVLDKFEELVGLTYVCNITAATIAEFKSARQKQRGRKPGSKVSGATVKRDLVHLQAALNEAHDRGYLLEVPKFKIDKPAEEEKNAVSPEHLVAMYQACEAAQRPEGPGYTAADWWRAFLMLAYTTGWRVGEILRLRRARIDFETGVVTLKATETKGKRPVRITLEPVVVDHLRKLQGFTERLFHIDQDKRFLYCEFAKIQDAAGIHLECDEDHQHTDACHQYGFHDLRRGFATENAMELQPFELKHLMRHKDIKTTMGYINLAKAMASKRTKVKVPDVSVKPAATAS
jgi:integrase